jgi:hypothetical protein
MRHAQQSTARPGCRKFSTRPGVPGSVRAGCAVRESAQARRRCGRPGPDPWPGLPCPAGAGSGQEPSRPDSIAASAYAPRPASICMMICPKTLPPLLIRRSRSRSLDMKRADHNGAANGPTMAIPRPFRTRRYLHEGSGCDERGRGADGDFHLRHIIATLQMERSGSGKSGQ